MKFYRSDTTSHPFGWIMFVFFSKSVKFLSLSVLTFHHGAFVQIYQAGCSFMAVARSIHSFLLHQQTIILECVLTFFSVQCFDTASYVTRRA